jgi:signal transduction histidine kinase/ligand-binding sensor domain-containing protein
MEWTHTRGPGVVARSMVALGLLLVCCPGVFALDPSLDVNQYAHTAWRFRDGFSRGRVTSFAQTPDGYLWLGTEFGLLRFDGVRTVPWRPPGDEQLPGNWVRALLTTPDGTLWIGTFRGLASVKNGTLTRYAELAGHDVYALLVDHEGTVWAGGGLTGVGGTLCSIQRGSAQCHGDGSGLGEWVASLYEDSDHNLWAAAQTGLWRWRPGPPTHYPMPYPVIGTSQALYASDHGTLMIATPDGISQLVDEKISSYQLPGTVPRLFKPQRLLRDRDGGLWIGTLDRGLLHVHHGRTDLFTQANGLSGNSVTKLFEDREGNIWVATMDGVDRFHDLAVRTISANQGLSSGSPWSVRASRDGSVWLGSNGGLSRWHDGQVTIYRKRSHPGLPDDGVGSLFEDHRRRMWVSTLRGMAYFEDGRFVPAPRLPLGHTHSIVGDTAGNLWLINDDQGLFHVREGRVVEQISWATLGLKEAATALLVDAAEGGVWIGLQGGVALVKNGRVRASYAVADGVVENRVNNLRLDRDGALWAATERGLSRVKDRHVVTLGSKNGLPCDAVHWSMEDDDQAVWLYMACGLVRIAATELNAGITDPKRRLQAAVFDGSGGVGLRGNTPTYDPPVAKGTDGKLWFLPNDGVSVFDPRRLSINTLPPPVHVEQVTADHQTYDASSDLRLPPLIRDLEIDYTALSFVAPEQNRFRVKLEGWDPDWRDVGNRRQAFYTNLAPGQYRFKVTASNNSGVWNETGAFLDLSVAPAYYQTAWFRVSSVVAVAALLWGTYRLRVRGIQQRSEQLALINAKLEAQIDEKKKAEVALRQAQADLAHANRVSSMGELSASLAHEVHQPITAAITDANTCLRWLSRDQPDVEEARAAASRAVQDGKRAGDIVNRVRLFFKKGTLQRELVDLNELIREMTLLLHTEAAQSAVSVRTALAADLPQLMADRVQLQQVLMNLMMNSIDAMKDVDGTRELTLQSQVGEDGHVLISVGDTGLGLPPHKEEQIFDAFFTTKSHGTGMGLRISRSIVEAHHGRLWASANSPCGARFSFTLPANCETPD